MIRNLVLSGGVGHPFSVTSSALAEVLAEVGIASEVDEDLESAIGGLAESGRFQMVTVNALRWRMLAERYAPQRPAFAFSLSEAARSALAGFVRSGGALLVVHTGVICFDDWPQWGEIVGGAWNWERSSHPPLGPVEMHVRTGVHPIVAGIEDFEVVDEAYGFLDLQPDVEPLASALHGGAEHPLLWARRFGAGRVVFSGLGHDQRAYAHPVYRRVLAGAAAWLGADIRAASQPPSDVDAPRRRAAAAAGSPTAPGADEGPRHVTVSTAVGAKEVFRQRDLRQALYDAGEVVMSDVLVNLHGDAHRNRRRLENRLFRRDTLVHYERDLFPGVIEETLAPYVAAGRAELVSLGHQLMMNLAAVTAGVDRLAGTAEETHRLYGYMMKFIEGATMAHAVSDRARRNTEIAAALQAFDEEFLRPSIERRATALGAWERGEIPEEDLPRDVLTVLLRNEDKLALADSIVLREIAFFLLAGAHTSATAFTRTIHHIFEWTADRTDQRHRVAEDRRFVQRCVLETVRLNPSSPIAMRRALGEVELSDGTVLRPGDVVTVDLLAANRDRAVYGESAAAFDPHRALGEGVTPFGLSFGSGMHACIGQDLATGTLHDDQASDEERQFGLVATAVQAMFDRGVRPDPDRPPQVDTTTARPYWASYPVVFEPGPAAP